MELANIKVYRMTHIENIPHLLQHGITHYKSPNANSHYITIGDITLINNRDAKQVYVNNGDYSMANPPSIVLGDFIPFYFGIRMPMLYVMQNGGNFVERATPAEEIVYLACPIDKIIDSGFDFYFTDGHATDNFTTFYNREKINELPTIIDWPAVQASYWSGQENLSLKRKKQAEFLVRGDLSPGFVTGIGCYNENAKRRLVDFGVDEKIIKVVPKAYY